MSKSKPKSSKGVAGPANTGLNKVKDASVSKPAQTPKLKSKEIAKKVAAKEGKKSKHKKVKEPTPEPESDSEESESSESESESEPEAKAPAKNGVAKGKVSAKAAGPQKDEVSDGESESSASSDHEEAGNVQRTAPAVAKAVEESSDKDVTDDDSAEGAAASAVVNDKSKTAAKTSGDDGSSDDTEESEESDDEKSSAINKPLGASQPNKNPAPAAPRKTSAKDAENSDEDDDESEGSSDTSDESDEESDEEEDEEEDEEVEPKRAASKRKAEQEAAPAVKKAKTGTDANESQGKNLFVGSLSWSVDEEWLTREFEGFGELTGVRIITDRNTGRSKGFGYVEFANAADAAAAHAAKQGAELDGRRINLDFATSRGTGDQKDKVRSRAKSFGDQPGEPTDTLWVGNISFDVDQDRLSTAFEEYGTIQGVRLPTDRETGALKGFGYVQYSSTDEAEAALEAMQGAELAGRPLRLDFSQPRQTNGEAPSRGGRGGARGGFGDRGRGGFGGRGGSRGGRGGRGGTTNRGGFGDFSGRKTTF